jgi:hypothetical protein
MLVTQPPIEAEIGCLELKFHQNWCNFPGFQVGDCLHIPKVTPRLHIHSLSEIGIDFMYDECVFKQCPK